MGPCFYGHCCIFVGFKKSGYLFFVVDNFGNIITNINGNRIRVLLDYGKKVMAFIGNTKKEMLFAKSYGSVKEGDILATIGSSDLLEFSINGGNAAGKIKAKPGDPVKILFG